MYNEVAIFSTVCIVLGIIGFILGATVDKKTAGFFLGALLGPIGWILVFLLPRENKSSNQTKENNSNEVRTNRIPSSVTTTSHQSSRLTEQKPESTLPQNEKKEAFLSQAYDEFESQSVDIETMLKVIVKSDGDINKERAGYIKLRADKLYRQWQLEERMLRAEAIKKAAKSKEEEIKRKEEIERNKTIDTLDDLWRALNVEDRTFFSNIFSPYSSFLSPQSKQDFSEEYNLSTKIWSAQHQLDFTTAVICLVKERGLEKFNFKQRVIDDANARIRTLPKININLSEKVVGILTAALDRT